MKPKYYILIILVLAVVAGAVYLYIDKTLIKDNIPPQGYLESRYQDYLDSEQLNFQDYPEYLLDTDKIKTFFGVSCKELKLADNGTRMVGICYEYEYIAKEHGIDMKRFQESIIENENTKAWFGVTCEKVELHDDGTKMVGICYTKEGIKEKDLSNNWTFAETFYLMKNYTPPCTDSCNCEIDFDDHIVIKRVIRTIGEYDEENPTTWIYDTSNGKSCSWKQFELISFKDYPQYSLNANKIEQLFQAIKCSKLKLVDNYTYEAACGIKESGRFPYKFRLKKYNDFQPCKPCPDWAYDCACDCDTNFKSGVVWEMTKRSMMKIITLIDVNSEEIICVRGSL